MCVLPKPLGRASEVGVGSSVSAPELWIAESRTGGPSTAPRLCHRYDQRLAADSPRPPASKREIDVFAEALS